MKESYEKGLASRSTPNPTLVTVTSWVWHGQGAHAGQPLSSDISEFRVPTQSCLGEGNTAHDANGESLADAAESKTLCMRGNSRFENREILLVSVLRQGRAERSENVSDGTADMNANRKSHGLIVPEKRVNKTGTPAAESVEERGSPEGTMWGSRPRRTRRRDDADNL
jgi:hypothetical protein